MDLSQIFGEGKDLHPLQSAARAVVVFIIALCLIRFSGKRSFGMRSPFDIVITILLGALLSRPISGIIPFWSGISSAITIVLMHKLFAWISLRSETFSKFTKSEPMLLYKNGKHFRENMKRCMITEKDLLEEVRIEGSVNSLDEIDSAYMECNGKISVVKNKKSPE
jgi:uncharacterized membrane protein YcaP (DUF421 family)